MNTPETTKEHQEAKKFLQKMKGQRAGPEPEQDDEVEEISESEEGEEEHVTDEGEDEEEDDEEDEEAEEQPGAKRKGKNFVI